MTLSEDRDDLLHREADLLGRLLVGRAPGPELSERYAAANRALMVAQPSRRDRILLDFAFRRPWALPPLDAAAGILAPGCLLRRKALLMTAILETTPDFVDDFLARPTSGLAFFARCGWLGIRAMGKLALGTLLWVFLLPWTGGGGDA